MHLPWACPLETGVSTVNINLSTVNVNLAVMLTMTSSDMNACAVVPFNVTFPIALIENSCI